MAQQREKGENGENSLFLNDAQFPMEGKKNVAKCLEGTVI